MGDIMAVFRMDEVSIEIRIRLLRKLGCAINSSYGMNITDELVNELVGILDAQDKVPY